MPETPQTATRKAVAALWQRNQPLILARLDLLDRAAAAADTCTLTPTMRAEAIAIAHNLAGSLGMFGFPEGTHLARELERALEQYLDSSAPTALTALTTRLRASLDLTA
jgi:HPt (histidine-containing phosphotransfer) domain-containing protein